MKYLSTIMGAVPAICDSATAQSQMHRRRPHPIPKGRSLCICDCAVAESQIAGTALILLIFLTLLMCLCSCQEKKQPSSTTPIRGIAMTVPYQITLGSETTAEEKKKVQLIAIEIFNHVDRTYNHYNPLSEISLFNAYRDSKPVKISKELSELLLLADKVYHETEGRFDPTVLTLQKKWREHLDQGEIPTEALSQHISWQLVTLDGLSLAKKNPEIELDLTGIAKGLCVDQITEALVKAGYHNFLVDWGGEIAARGQHPEGRPWRLFISHFGSHQPEKNLGIVEMDDNAIATSGNYLQQWEANESVYTHIFDMQKGEPLKVEKGSLASVSVLAPSCAYADALATSIMLFKNVDHAREWSTMYTTRHPEIKIWVHSDYTERDSKVGLGARENNF